MESENSATFDDFSLFPYSFYAGSLRQKDRPSGVENHVSFSRFLGARATHDGASLGTGRWNFGS